MQPIRHPLTRITAYIVPGRPVANMYGALYGQHPMQQGIAFLQDLKLGQYIKLAPRVTFCMQMAGRCDPHHDLSRWSMIRFPGTVVGAILNCKCRCSFLTDGKYIERLVDVMMLSIINANRPGMLPLLCCVYTLVQIGSQLYCRSLVLGTVYAHTCFSL